MVHIGWLYCPGTRHSSLDDIQILTGTSNASINISDLLISVYLQLEEILDELVTGSPPIRLRLRDHFRWFVIAPLMRQCRRWRRPETEGESDIDDLESGKQKLG